MIGGVDACAESQRPALYNANGHNAVQQRQKSIKNELHMHLLHLEQAIIAPFITHKLVLFWAFARSAHFR